MRWLRRRSAWCQCRITWGRKASTAAILPIGKPEKQVSKLTRKPVTEFASRERFDGEPFSA